MLELSRHGFMHSGLAAAHRPGFAVLSALLLGAVLAHPVTAAEPTATGASAQGAGTGTGESLFVEKCAMCHRAGGMGAGLLSRRYPKGQEILESRTNLSAAFVRTVVRGGLNNMPPLSRAEVSNAQLASITAYLAKGNP